MGKIITIGVEKGGTGKSCTCQNLSVFFMKKNYDVLIVDADPQETTADWEAERESNKDLKNIPCTQMSGNISENLVSFKNKYDLVLVDVGGQDSKALRSAMVSADLLVMPLRPKRRDLKTLPHMAELLEECLVYNKDLIYRALITQCNPLPSQSARILEAKAICRSYEIQCFDSIIYTRNIYDDAEENGASVLELTTDAKAAREMELFGQEVERLIWG